MKPSAPRPKRCAKTKGGCGAAFIQTRPMQQACSPQCAIVIAVTKRAKSEKAAAKVEKTIDKARREKLKTRSEWLADAQVAFNAWVRLRDAHLPCVSCGRHHEGKWNAGHFLSRGARPELRFDPANVHKQCEPCNSYLSGNVALYRAELLRRIGQAEVERLEGPHSPRKYSLDEIKAVRDEYRAKARALEKLETQ